MTDAAAVEAVRRTLALAAIATDRMDWEQLRSRYEPDARVDLGGFFDGSIDEYIASNSSPEGLPSLDSTFHSLSTSLIEVSGSEAVAETYATCYHHGPPDHAWCQGFVVIYMRFLDELVERDGTWRISRRRGAFEWGRNETTGTAMELDPSTLSRRDRSDVRYSLFGDS
ncbi:nuclear transport factor 2 family protein [Dietzia aurantiaca]|uniref:Nuclear transport factor 2 family protein n=1 Tax=Dietzia aurantiaca TaxID=983873 RepID=A0ABV9PWM3_9ACTN